MKKIIRLSVLAAMLVTVSCQQESRNPSDGGMVEFSVTAGIPGAIGTYSPTTFDSSEAFSHLGGAMNVDPEKFDLRYIIEIWTKEETPRLAYRDVQSVDKDFLNTPVNFSMRIQSLSYYLVLWADFVEQGSTADLHYTTDNDLQQIRYAADIVDAGDLAADDLDAYCAVETVDFVTEGMNKSITLHRPFGKLRLIATDKIDSDGFVNIKPTVATIDFKDVQFANTYNALTEKAGVTGETRSAGKFDFQVIREDAFVSDSTYEGAYLLGFDYFFVMDQTPSYSIDVTVYGDESKSVELNKISLSSIPVSTNQLTTVIGNFYSSEGTVSIIVDDRFDEEKPVE